MSGANHYLQRVPILKTPKGTLSHPLLGPPIRRIMSQMTLLSTRRGIESWNVQADDLFADYQIGDIDVIDIRISCYPGIDPFVTDIIKV